MPSVFLSHSHDDKGFVRNLAVRLTQAGATVWLDEAELGVGDFLVDRISAAIGDADYVVAILSPRSVKSAWVQKELNLAMTKEIKGHCVTVLPVVIESCDVPQSLSDKLYADFAAPENYEAELAKLFKAIGLVPETVSTATVSPSTPQGAEDVVYLVPRTIADQVADLHRERKAERFVLVQADHGTREYSLQEVDRLTRTQRTKLFAADPEMEQWWRGRSLTNGAWPLYRVRGGIWLAKEQIDRAPQQDQQALRDEIPGLLDWYLEGQQF